MVGLERAGWVWSARRVGLERAVLGLERAPASKFGSGARGCDPIVYNIFGYGAVRSAPWVRSAQY